MQMLQSLGDLSHTISHWCAVAGGRPRNGDFIFFRFLWWFEGKWKSHSHDCLCKKLFLCSLQLANCGPDEFYCWQMLEATGITPACGYLFGQKEGTHHFRWEFLIHISRISTTLRPFEMISSRITQLAWFKVECWLTKRVRNRKDRSLSVVLSKEVHLSRSLPLQTYNSTSRRQTSAHVRKN